MNILPKKRWHVRTRENIARVRRDEAAAAVIEQQQQDKIKLAEKEARVALLRAQAKARNPQNSLPIKPDPVPAPEEVASPTSHTADATLIAPNGHVNLFYELEQNDIVSNQKNADHEKEAKQEREKEEMKIGYLTYLGQDTCELTGQVSWYNLPPRARHKEDPPPAPPTTPPPLPPETSLPQNNPLSLISDPIKDIRQYLTSTGLRKVQHSDKKSKKVKKRKKERRILKLARKILKKRKRRNKNKRSVSSSSSSSSSSDDSEDYQPKNKRRRTSKCEVWVEPETNGFKTPDADLEALRAERLRRERVERERAAAHLAALRGEVPSPAPLCSPPPAVLQKYNSQFNPYLAKQNYS